MSTIITSDTESGRPKILIHAPSCRTFLHATDFAGYIIQITGEAENPFIIGVRFIGCTVIAENMKAFDRCYFDDGCQMMVKNMPKIIHTKYTAETINSNRIATDA